MERHRTDRRASSGRSSLEIHRGCRRFWPVRPASPSWPDVDQCLPYLAESWPDLDQVRTQHRRNLASIGPTSSKLGPTSPDVFHIRSKWSNLGQGWASVSRTRSNVAKHGQTDSEMCRDAQGNARMFQTCFRHVPEVFRVVQRFRFIRAQVVRDFASMHDVEMIRRNSAGTFCAKD